MTNFQLTEKDFAGINCNDLSIQELPFGKILLILMCQDAEGSSKLLEILSTNAFKLSVSVNDETGFYKFDFHFPDAGLGFVFDTKKSEKLYPPLKKILNNKINFISTGVWNQDTSKGRTFNYNSNLLRVGELNIADCLKHAKEVQFVSGEPGVRASAVVLIYDNYDHIYASESHDAFNLLLSMSKNELHMEFKKNDDKITLRIWDIMIDLDFQIEDMDYSKEQFDNFINNTDKSSSFGFFLGLKPSGDELISAVSTKQGKLDIITIHGYEINDISN